MFITEGEWYPDRCHADAVTCKPPRPVPQKDFFDSTDPNRTYHAYRSVPVPA